MRWFFWRGGSDAGSSSFPDDICIEVAFLRRRHAIAEDNDTDFTVLIDLPRMLVYLYKGHKRPYVYVREDLLDE